MSAMLDTYDMQMLDYSGDLDVQMHPSSSDAWFQDEAQMEEDGLPLTKHESDGALKVDAYTHEKVGGTIEVDMEPSLDLHNAEYDMLDEEEIHSGEILDIEVYDASQVQSPAMFALDSEQGETFHQPFETPDLGSTLNNIVPVGSLNPPLEPSDTHTIPDDEFPSASEVFVQPPIFEKGSEEQPAVGSSESAAELTNTSVNPSSEFHSTKSYEGPIEGREICIQGSEGPETEIAAVAAAAESLEESAESELDGPPTHVQSDHVPHDNTVPTDIHDALDSIVIPNDTASSGDPHEISEGVYIDPPPPVLLSVGSDDGFDFSLFNEPSTWNEGVQKNADAKDSTHILLHHLPTLYYEPLSTVFEALRQEDFIRSLFSIAETELILEAVDLRLTLSEDNIYAREVTLHDLNVLHDVSGINGLLRMRLFTSTTPRFIIRYQHLQDGVSRLDLGLLAEGLPVNANADDALPYEEQHETSEPPKEYEAAQNQTDEQSIHDEEGQAVEEVEGDEPPREGQAHQHYEEQEQVSEPASNLQEQTEELHANDEGISVNKQNTTEVTSADHPLLTQDDSLSNQHLVDLGEKNDESQTPTHHSTPTSGSRDIGESVHEEEDAGVIALEAVEAHLHDAEYAEDVNPLGAEYKGEHELQYPEYDADELEEFGEEQQQEEDQGHQPQSEAYEEEEEGNEQQQNQKEHQETQLNQFEAHHEIQNPEEADQLPSPTTDKPEQLISAGASEPENESIYEQTTTVGEGTNYSEGDYLNDVNVAFDGFAPTEPNDELSHVEEAEGISHDTTNPPDPLPEIPEFVGEEWEDDLDGEGEVDDTWDEDNEVETAQSNSNNSSITLSSKASKRSYDELDSDGNGDEDGDSHHWTPPSSPGPKRSRTH